VATLPNFEFIWAKVCRNLSKQFNSFLHSASTSGCWRFLRHAPKISKVEIHCFPAHGLLLSTPSFGSRLLSYCLHCRLFHTSRCCLLSYCPEQCPPCRLFHTSRCCLLSSCLYFALSYSIYSCADSLLEVVSVFRCQVPGESLFLDDSDGPCG